MSITESVITEIMKQMRRGPTTTLCLPAVMDSSSAFIGN